MSSIEDWQSLPKLDWKECERAESLEELTRCRAVRLMKMALELPRSENGPGYASSSVGLNAGTTFVSFNLKVKGRNSSTLKMSTKSDKRENEVVKRLGEALAVMLACHPGQEKLEMQHGIGNGLLANLLIEQFAEITGVALCHVKWNKTSSNLRAVFCSLATVKDKLSGKTIWRYSPSYLDFFRYSGGEADEHSVLPSYDESAERKIARDVVNDMWTFISSQHYIVDRGIFDAFDGLLVDYVLNGLVGPGETFVPSAVMNKAMAFYLWGGAGVGKSTFVNLVGPGLQKGFRNHVCPAMQVNLVKVPLNSVSPEHLQHILRIQGISDWSVERMLEQSVAKENLVILHLEENPEDVEIQSRMFNLVHAAVNHLLRKYPERPGAVLYVITSNYAHCSLLEDFCRATIFVNPPGPDDQFLWARTMLESKIQLALSCTSEQLKITLQPGVRPPVASDMRPLNNWWLSLGFYGVVLARDASKSGFVELVFSSTIGKDGSSVVHVHVNTACSIPQPSFALSSLDGFFYFDSSARQDPLQCILEMSVEGYTTPGVVFVDAASLTDIDQSSLDESIVEYKDRVLRGLRDINRDVHVRVAEIGELVDEDDKEKIYGDPSEIRGGLFKFIDDTTNPNVPVCRTPGDCSVCGPNNSCLASMDDGSIRIALVFATVSQVGQFMLRELLEAAPRSRTHRTSILKKHLLFVLFTKPGQPLVSQSVSRAHFIDKLDY